jgi:hypothetical protein
LLGFHARESRETGTTAGVGENGFRLIFGVMGEEDVGCAMLLGGLLEKAVTSLTGGGFQGEAFGFGEGSDVGFSDFAEKGMLFGETANESGVLIGLFTTEAVVQVAEDEVAVALSK